MAWFSATLGQNGYLMKVWNFWNRGSNAISRTDTCVSHKFANTKISEFYVDMRKSQVKFKKKYSKIFTDSSVNCDDFLAKIVEWFIVAFSTVLNLEQLFCWRKGRNKFMPFPRLLMRKWTRQTKLAFELCPPIILTTLLAHLGTLITIYIPLECVGGERKRKLRLLQHQTNTQVQWLNISQNSIVLD